MLYPATTLGSAILIARDMATGYGPDHTNAEAATVIQYPDLRLAVLPSAEYARLRESSQHGGMTPLLSFLPRGGLDVHRAAFEGVGDALTNHPR